MAAATAAAVSTGPPYATPAPPPPAIAPLPHAATRRCYHDRVPAAFLDGGGETALLDAVRVVEAASSAEVVIAVRRRSAAWLHAPVITGAVAAFAALAFMLFAPTTFSLPSILIDPFVIGALVGAATSQVHPLIRALTPRTRRRRAVHAAALVAFHDRGVHLTRARTGVLVYVSLLEQMAEVIADAGITAAVDSDALARATAAIDAAVAGGGDATARAIAALAPLLGAALPRAADDVNELADALHVDRAR
jgi:putative membrane protein